MAMKRRITLILVLMSLCVTGITGLQLFWNYQNYKSTVKTFKHDINAALNNAVEREMEQRRQNIIGTFKTWMADTSFVTITCDVENRDSSTVFHVNDAHPYEKSERGFTMGITDFTEKLRTITPKAKSTFIHHFADTTVNGDLRNGTVYYYTQRLGDSLAKRVTTSRCNFTLLNRLYKNELASMEIDAPFNLNPDNRHDESLFVTGKINTGLQRPHQKEYVYAGFQSPDAYFFKEMKWLLLTSLLLIGITIFCFAYTVKTLLSQHKLAELKNDFVNNMTHELKTPIATINIAAEAIQDFNLSKASANEYLGIIRYQAGNLSHLVDQILKSVVLEQETNTLNLVKTNLVALLNQLIPKYKPQSDLVNAIINFQHAAAPVLAFADIALFKNAIANLLDNALKYGGEAAQIDIKLSTDNNNVLLSIADNGPGIPLQYQDKVFERFFRVPTGDVHNVKGYGLGLSYAKDIVERHRGKLTLISNGHNGTEFIISIPIIYNETRQSTVA